MNDALQEAVQVGVGTLDLDGSPMTAAEFSMAMEGLGFTRQQIADRLGVTVMTVGHWIRGKYQVPPGVEETVTGWLDRKAELVEELVAALGDERHASLALPRDEAGGFPAGYWRMVAVAVEARVPGLRTGYADAE